MWGFIFSSTNPLQDHLIIHFGAFQMFSPSGKDLTRWRVSCTPNPEPRLFAKGRLQWMNQWPQYSFKRK